MDESVETEVERFSIRNFWEKKQAPIAILAVVAIIVHLILRYGYHFTGAPVDYPLYVALLFGGTPLVIDLIGNALRREFGSDLLAGMSIVTAVLLGEYLAGTFVVLMLSGGESIEAYAVRRASTVLRALAKRMPSIAHRKNGSGMEDVALPQVQLGDQLIIFPHEICPVDGTVIEGHGVMDESYLTGEPYMMSKTPGSEVLSGAINGETALTIRADKLATDSRYAKIMEVMKESQQHRPRIRRLGDQLGAIYTPVAVAIAIMAWLISGEAIRFLAVLVVATPCPLLIAIPVAIIGSISLSARYGIIVKNPAVLEKLDTCRTVIFDKTGTLTYGKPNLTEQILVDSSQQAEGLATGRQSREILQTSAGRRDSRGGEYLKPRTFTRFLDQRETGRRTSRDGGRSRGRGHQSQTDGKKNARGTRPTARACRRSGMPDFDRRTVRRDLPFSR